MIYTGCYGNMEHYNGTLAGIARKPKKDVPIASWLIVAPTDEMLQKLRTGKIDRGEFISLYKKDVLGRITPEDKEEIRKYLELFNNKDNDLFLICYESVGKFCHRHLLADWIEETFGFPVEEYKIR